MLAGRRQVSLAAEFEPSSRPHKTMLRKLVLKAQRKIHIVDSEISNMTAYTSTVCEMLYGSMNSTLAQVAVKIYLSRVHARSFRYRM
jgi:ribosomal protein S24E